MECERAGAKVGYEDGLQYCRFQYYNLTLAVKRSECVIGTGMFAAQGSHFGPIHSK
jgi:hypothetical protein